MTERNNALTVIAQKNAEARRVQKRIHAGVCPHCNRTFQNLQSHMNSKHNGEAAQIAETTRRVAKVEASGR